MNARLSRALACIAAVSIAACSGTASLPDPGARGSLKPTGSGRPAATITLKIPHATDARAVARYLSKRPDGRRRAYVSPATQSIGIDVTDSSNTTTTTNASLTVSAASSGANPVECTSEVLSTLCTITLALAPGSYTASFTTYDGPLDMSGAPTGNKLSQNQNVPFTVTAGAANALTVSLAAIPAGVSIVPAFNEKLVRGNQTDGFSLIATGQIHSFNVEAFDADGDTIVGPGAPTWSTDLEGGSLGGFLSVQVPTAANPNTFTLLTGKHLPDGFPRNPQVGAAVTVEMTAVPPDGAGVTCTADTCSRTVGFTSLDAFFAGFTNKAGIYVAGDTAPIQTTPMDVYSSVVDTQGDVYFSVVNKLYEWTPPYDQSPVLVTTNPNVTAIKDLTFDPYGTLFYQGTVSAIGSACVFSSAAPYTTSADLACGFSFSREAPERSRLLADANNRFIVADDNSIIIDGVDGTHSQAIAVKTATVLLDTSGELIVFNDTAQTLTSYFFNDGTGMYAATGNVYTNTGTTEHDSPMRNGNGSFSVPYGEEQELATFQAPFTDTAPTITSVPIISYIDDFEFTANGRNFAGLDGAGQNVTEIYNFGVGEISVTAQGYGQTETISDIP